MEAFYTDGTVALHQADALDLLGWLDASSVSLIFADPPYYKVKGEWWDRQWKDEAAFLAWIGQLCDEFKRVLAPNGSLYLCASPQMSYAVEGEVRKRFDVLNSIRWYKQDGTFSRADVTTYRSWLSAWEAVIFAEQWRADGDYQDVIIDENLTYQAACENVKRQVFGNYLLNEFKRAGVTSRQVATLFPSRTGKLTGCVSNWLLGYNCPTQEQYLTMRTYLNGVDSSEYLHERYEDLRERYEDLRERYEDLRRPFNNSTDLFRDDWHYAQIEADDIKHETEKPLQMLLDIVQTSSRPGDLVVDPFLGRGATAVACQMLGRRFVGGDIQKHWVEATQARLAEARGEMHLRPRRPVEPQKAPKGQTSMWELLE